MSRETVEQITMEDLGIRKTCAKMVPQILIDDHKHWLHISSDLLYIAQMCEGVITGNEKQCLQYDAETKCHSKQQTNSMAFSPQVNYTD
jgi:hypothetical protein